MKKVLPPTLFLICLIGMGIFWWWLPLQNWLNFPWTLLGFIPFVIGLSLAIMGSNLFNKIGTNIKTFNDPDILVTENLFRYSRNPMYLGFVVALMGIAILLGTASAWLFVILFFIVTDRWYIQFEETVMENKFGEQYTAYKKQTRRWL